MDNKFSEYILDQMGDALIYADITGKIQRWNAAASRLFGFSKEEVIGESMDIIIPEKARKAHWHGFNLAIQSGELKLSGKPTLTRALHKNAEKRIYVEMSFALIKNDGGEVIGSVAIAREVERNNK